MIRKPTFLIVICAVVLLAGVAVLFSTIKRIATQEKRPNDSADAAAAPAPGRSISPVDEGWVGSQACAECHQDIATAYQTHPMAHSAAAIAVARVVEDYDGRNSFARPQSRHYRVERSGDRVFHHESMTDGDGEVIYDQAVEIHYALGSGKRGRSYLIDRGGVIYESPISWYAAANRWDLSPGYEPLSHQRFDRRATDECLNCHMGRLSFQRDAPDRYGQPAIIEAAIGCERCHGPGRDHVRRHQSPDDTPNGKDSIVNPARLDLGRREDVCNQCHLPGRRIPRHARAVYDFRPGQRLEEVASAFMTRVAGEENDSTRAVGQVEQMRESVCFERSAGSLGCTSCHDPHSSPSATGRLAFYSDRCLTCHIQRGCSLPSKEREDPTAGGACINCHMPRFAAKDVPHTSQTDHRILRRPDAVAPQAPHDEFELFGAAEERLATVELHRARGLRQMQLRRHLDPESTAQLEQLFKTVLQEYPDDVEVLDRMGTLALAQGRFAEAEEFWRAVLRLRPQHEGALLRMARLHKEQGNLGEAIDGLRRYIAFNPWLADIRAILAQLLWQSGDSEAAIAEAMQGLELDPRHLPLRNWLSQSLRQMGRTGAAEEQEQALKRMHGR